MEKAMTSSAMHNTSRRQQILSVLERADCTSATVARLTGMPPKTASSKLCELHQLGAVTREAGYGRKGRPGYLYSIKSRFEPSISHPRDARGETGPALYQEGM